VREARFYQPLRGKDKQFLFALKIGKQDLADSEPTKTFPNWQKLCSLIRNFIIFDRQAIYNAVGKINSLIKTKKIL